MLSPFEQVLLLVMMLAIMFGMGASLTAENFKNILRNPRGILIGFVSQFAFMPLIAYGLARLLNLTPQESIALILIGALPAGTTSNMFAYFSRGDVALSISMTLCSTVVAFVMTPLLLNLYGAEFALQLSREMQAAGGSEFKIPTANVLVSLLSVLIPVLLGLWLRKRSPGKAKVSEEIASFLGIAVILFLIVTWVPKNSGLLATTKWNVYVGAIMVGVIGFLFGYVTSALTGLPPRMSRTIALETGIQNGPLAFAIVVLSFQEPLRTQILWVPLLYSLFIVITSTIATLFFRKVGRVDYEMHQNHEVHMELFGREFYRDRA